MKNIFFQLSCYIIIVLLLFIVTGCSSKKEMTAKSYCEIQKKIADLGVNKYFDSFVNKEYEEMSKTYLQYVNECKAIYKKYNTSGALLMQWAEEHEEEIAECLKSNPELNYAKTHGEKYDKFTWNIYNFLEEKVKRETEEE